MSAFFAHDLKLSAHCGTHLSALTTASSIFKLWWLDKVFHTPHTDRKQQIADYTYFWVHKSNLSACNAHQSAYFVVQKRSETRVQ